MPISVRILTLQLDSARSGREITVLGPLVSAESNGWGGGGVGPQGPQGAQGNPGADGTDGQDGASAYEIAVANGFVGTEAEWLASLEGADGQDGADGTNGTNGTNGQDGTNGTDGQDGASAYEIAVANGFVGTEAEWLASLEGADGQDGADGATGPQGPEGPQGPAGSGGGGASSFAQFTNGGTPNINATAAWGAIDPDWSADISHSDFSVSADGSAIVCNFTGTVDVSFLVRGEGNTDRVSPEVALTLAGTRLAGIASTGYIRNTQGHNESSWSFSRLVAVTSGQEIGMTTQQGSIGGAVTMTSGESLFTFRRLA